MFECPKPIRAKEGRMWRSYPFHADPSIEGKSKMLRDENEEWTPYLDFLVATGAVMFARYASRTENIGRFSSEEIYSHNKSEWTVRFTYLVSGRLFSRAQVKHRLLFLAQMARWHHLDSDEAPKLSPCFLKTNTESSTTDAVVTKKLHVHLCLTNGSYESLHGRLKISRHAYDEPLILTIQRCRFKEQGLLLDSDQPLTSGASLTLLNGEDTLCTGYPGFVRQGSEPLEDCVSWTYQISLPRKVTEIMEKYRVESASTFELRAFHLEA
ncbi:hypothetical protein NMY22_g1246 [Coprinellus aureogranulatus]|nr:hypothetical protein NMY22_g1246 [Coprinellus aureogranulatus]